MGLVQVLEKVAPTLGAHLAAVEEAVETEQLLLLPQVPVDVAALLPRADPIVALGALDSSTNFSIGEDANSSTSNQTKIQGTPCGGPPMSSIG